MDMTPAGKIFCSEEVKLALSEKIPSEYL